MKLFTSPTSPFVRKCLVCAEELGLRARLDLVPAMPHPVNRDRSLIAFNPLGKIPTLITDEGRALFDSRVICEYFDVLAGSALPGQPARSGGLIPAGAQRWSVLCLQALADGVMDAAVLCRYEAAARPEALRWSDWTVGQLDKVNCSLDEFERLAPAFADRVDLGTISVGCALGYLDLRFDGIGWRNLRPALAKWFVAFGGRASMLATRHPG